MNKDSIYRIIGYQGKYTDSVKKALRKLLKENHPDNKGDVEIFKLINEVKKELETNQVSFQYNKKQNNHYDDIDTTYCREMLEKLEKERQHLSRIFTKKHEELKAINNKYKGLYDKSINEEKSFYQKEKITKELKKIKETSIILLIILIITFAIAIIENNIIIFIVFGVMSLMSILIIEKYFVIFHKISNESERKVHKYMHIVDDIKENIIDRERIMNDILEIKRKIEKVENDIRFYKNILK